jgi:hypothetical protein
MGQGQGVWGWQERGGRIVAAVTLVWPAPNVPSTPEGGLRACMCVWRTNWGLAANSAISMLRGHPHHPPPSLLLPPSHHRLRKLHLMNESISDSHLQVP